MYQSNQKAAKNVVRNFALMMAFMTLSGTKSLSIFDTVAIGH